MKNMRIPSAAFLICGLALTSGSVNAQSVSILPISRTSFCAGDSIAVSFTVTGFFGHRNAFTLQLSDPTGSFSNFQNIGSLVDTLPGTFTINTTIPVILSSSAQYRFRILAAIPYITSADNGSDIAITARPNVGFNVSIRAGSTGTPITFDAYTDPIESPGTAFWDFGSGATPATATTNAIVTTDPYDHSISTSFSQSVTYSTPGHKTVTLTVVNPAGCSSKSVTYEKLSIYDCSNPSIPHDAIVINSDTTLTGSGVNYWINPGFKVLFQGDYDTIFAEPGSTLTNPFISILYLKPGSVYIANPGENNVIFGDGANINTSPEDFTLHCPSLDFDYTNAPPNAAHPADGVAATSVTPITISPNPTRGIISIQGAPSNDLNISVMNLLGETIMQLKNPHSPDFTLDLSKLVAGTYYIRFSSANSVVTRVIIKN